MKNYHKIEKVERCPECGALDSLKVVSVLTRGKKRRDGKPVLLGGEVRRQYKSCTLCGARVVVSIRE